MLRLPFRGGAGVGPAVGKCIKRCEQSLKNAFDVPTYFAVREAKRCVAAVRGDLIAHRISRGVMGVAVNLDDQCFLRTKEVDDVVADHVLTSEFVASKLRSTDVAPEQRLERRAVVAQSSCSVDQVLRLPDLLPHP